MNVGGADRRGVVAVDAAGTVWSLSRWCGVKSRELQAEISDHDQLPDVTAAKQIAKGLQPSVNQHERPDDDPYRKKLDDLIRRQREDRALSLDAQKQQEAERLRQKPRGLKIAFLKVTGRYHAFVNKCAEDTAQAKAGAANRSIDRNR